MRESGNGRPEGSRRLRHCMVVHAYYPSRETRVQREAAALIRRGFEVDVICLRDEGEPARETLEGVRVHRLPVGRRPGRGLGAQLLEYLSFLLLATGLLSWLQLVRRYDSVQLHNLPDFLVFAALVPKAMGVPVLLDLHDLMPEFFAAKTGAGMGSPLVRLIRWQERLACAFADRVITVTEAWKQSLVERGVPADKIDVVMNVPDDRVFRPSLRDTGGERNGHPFQVLYHGTMVQRYGVDLLVRAAKDLATEIPGLRVRLHGDGEALSDIVALRDDLGLEGTVTITSDVRPVEELAQMIASADVAVVPNRDDLFTTAILPTKLLEYVAVGTPVVAARTRAIAGHFTDEMLEFFRPDDASDLARAVRRLHDEPERARRLVEGAAVFRRGHSWEELGAVYAETVRGLAEGRGKSGRRPRRLAAALAVARRGKGLGGLVRRGQEILGRYGLTSRRMEEAIGRFEAVLGDFDAPATFPTTAVPLTRSRGTASRSLQGRAEIALHGLHHVDHHDLSLEDQLRSFTRGREILEESHLRCQGFRAPYLRWNQSTLVALRRLGFLYDASQAVWWDIDFPDSDSYRRAIEFYSALPVARIPSLPTIDDGLVRIPYSLPDDEAIARRPVGEAGDSPAWCRILERSHELGELFVVGLHPERIDEFESDLRAVLSRARSRDVWIARLDEIARWWIERTAARVEVDEDGHGSFTLRVEGPPGVRVELRGVETDSPVGSGGAAATGETTVGWRSDVRPFVGVSDRTHPRAVQLLREQGFVVETADGPGRHALFLDHPAFHPDETRPLLDRAAAARPLVRLARWPHGATSALAVTGDIDALTFWDYALRSLGR